MIAVVHTKKLKTHEIPTDHLFANWHLDQSSCIENVPFHTRQFLWKHDHRYFSASIKRMISYCFPIYPPNSIKTDFRKIDKVGNNSISYSSTSRWVLCRIQLYVYNHWFFNEFFVLLCLTWSIFLKTVFMTLGRVGNNRISYYFFTKLSMVSHILRGFVVRICVYVYPVTFNNS